MHDSDVYLLYAHSGGWLLTGLALCCLENVAWTWRSWFLMAIIDKELLVPVPVSVQAAAYKTALGGAHQC